MGRPVPHGARLSKYKPPLAANPSFRSTHRVLCTSVVNPPFTVRRSKFGDRSSESGVRSALRVA